MILDLATSTSVPRISVDPFGEEFLSDPYRFHHELRDAGPLVWLSTYGVYGMARYDEVSAALQDWKTFCSGRGVGLSDFAAEPPWRPPSLLLETDPPKHDDMRRIVAPVVSPGALKAVRPVWLKRAEELVDALVARCRFDAITDLAEAFPLCIFPETIGLREDGREHLLSYAAAVFNAFGPRNARFETTNRSAAAAVEWVTEACSRQWLREGGWGMAVYSAADAGLCSEDEAARLVRSFLSAGVDTTINGLGNMLHAFACFPEQWRKLRNDPTLKRRAFEEALRWDSTVQTFFRTTTRDVDIEGMSLPKGSKVLLFLAAANRDPRHWEEPDVFDITRHTSGHVGFGLGLHQCLGQMIARQEAELILDALLSRVASIQIAGPVIRRMNNTLRAVSSLPVEVEPA